MDEKLHVEMTSPFERFYVCSQRTIRENELVKTNVNSGWDKKEEDVPKVVIPKKKKSTLKKLLEVITGHKATKNEMLAADPDVQRNMKLTRSTGKMLIWYLKL